MSRYVKKSDDILNLEKELSEYLQSNQKEEAISVLRSLSYEYSSLMFACTDMPNGKSMKDQQIISERECINQQFLLTKQLAEFGNVYAQLELGQLYWKGPKYRCSDDAAESVYKKDRKLATYWLEQAANQGNEDAMVWLGSVLFDVELERSIYWYEKAFSAGNTIAYLDLGNHYYHKKQYDEAVSWYMKAYEAGDISALFIIADTYRDIDDHDNAAFWFRKLASETEAHETDAFLQMNNYRRSGNSFAEQGDMKTALELYEKGLQAAKDAKNDSFIQKIQEAIAKCRK